MLNVLDFLTIIVRPTLVRLDLHSPAAEALVLGTAVQETGLGRLTQARQGPARGLYQIEPATNDDIMRRIGERWPHLAERLGEIAGVWPDMVEQLATNLAYATAVCRLKYWLVAAPLPPADDPQALGEYWKLYWNSVDGAGTVAQFAANFRKYAAPYLPQTLTA